MCGDPDLRVRWGCDAPAREPITVHDSCLVCHVGLPDCPACKGANTTPFYRCPHRVVKQRHVQVVDAICAMVDCGVLPDDGGMQDQAAVFVASLPVLRPELAHWQNEQVKAASGQ